MWLKAGLGIAALAVGRTKGTYLAAQYHRLRPRRGEKRTIVAVAHSMLVSTYHMLANDVPYQDLGPDYITRRLGEERHRRRLLAQLGTLGYDVTLERRQRLSHFGASLEDHGANVVLTRQVHRLPDAPEAYGAMITRAKAAPAKVATSTARYRAPRGTAGQSSPQSRNVPAQRRRPAPIKPGRHP
ncbi:hypothetical protein ACWDFR_27475 [Streptomyces sp. 900105755]